MKLVQYMSKALICGRDTGVPCIPLKLPAKAGEFYEIGAIYEQSSYMRQGHGCPLHPPEATR